jgi:hypothetical protein
VAARDRERERLVIEQRVVLEHPAPAGQVIEGVAFAAAEAEEAERKQEKIDEDEGQPARVARYGVRTHRIQRQLAATAAVRR